MKARAHERLARTIFYGFRSHVTRHLPSGLAVRTERVFMDRVGGWATRPADFDFGFRLNQDPEELVQDTYRRAMEFARIVSEGVHHEGTKVGRQATHLELEPVVLAGEENYAHVVVRWRLAGCDS